MAQIISQRLFQADRKSFLLKTTQKDDLTRKCMCIERRGWGGGGGGGGDSESKLIHSEFLPPVFAAVT